MARIEMEWNGIPALQGVLRAAPKNGTDGMVAVVGAVLSDAFDMSQAQVPVDTGALKASGGLDAPVPGGTDIAGSIYYTARYAFFVHEDLHANHPRGGKAKFVEDPMRSAANDLPSKARSMLEAAIIGQGMGPGSKNHSAESSAMSSHINRRSLSRRGGIRADQVSAMLARAESYRHVEPEHRPTVVNRRGRVGLKFFAGREESAGEFDYQPPSSSRGEVMGRIPRRAVSTRSARKIETMFHATVRALRRFSRRDFHA